MTTAELQGQRRRRLAVRLRAARSAGSLSLRELGRRSGVDYAHICDVEHARVSPRLDTLVALADALNVDPRELL